MENFRKGLDISLALKCLFISQINFAMLQKSKKCLFFFGINTYLHFHSAKVRVEMLDINSGRGHARSYHFSLLQIILYPNYFIKIPPLLFLRPSGKRSNKTFLSNLF